MGLGPASAFPNLPAARLPGSFSRKTPAHGQQRIAEGIDGQWEQEPVDLCANDGSAIRIRATDFHVAWSIQSRHPG